MQAAEASLLRTGRGLRRSRHFAAVCFCGRLFNGRGSQNRGKFRRSRLHDHLDHHRFGAGQVLRLCAQGRRQRAR